MKQLTRSQAQQIADKAVEQAKGFTLLDESKTIQVSPAEVYKFAVKAAVIALEQAGCLAAANKAEQERTDRLATAAERRHQAWCKGTGARC